MKKTRISLLFPKDLVDKLDEYKKEKGFMTRTQLIIYLLYTALEKKI
jgi:metal-responsive CopG/Arc/MetJ family transcriptional regulator